MTPLDLVEKRAAVVARLASLTEAGRPMVEFFQSEAVLAYIKANRCARRFAITS